jgi:hypothetical protein
MEEFRDHRTISCRERIYAFPTKFVMGFFKKKEATIWKSSPQLMKEAGTGELYLS